MPASGQKTRHAAIGLLAGAGAGALALPAAAQSDEDDAPLLDRWRSARARRDAIMEQIWALDKAIEVPLPDALIKSEWDTRNFRTDEAVGDHCRLHD